MSFNPASSCPPWCDPRLHVEHFDAGTRNPSGTCEHRSAGMTWTPASADVEITTCSSRLDNREPVTGHIGDVHLLVRLEDTASVHPGGHVIAVEMDLDPIDGDMLIAVLGVELAKVRALRARQAVA